MGIIRERFSGVSWGEASCREIEELWRLMIVKGLISV